VDVLQHEIAEACPGPVAGASSKPTTAAMCGCESEASRRASRSKRITRSESAAMSCGSVLMATDRPRLVSSARYTFAHSAHADERADRVASQPRAGLQHLP